MSDNRHSVKQRIRGESGPGDYWALWREGRLAESTGSANIERFSRFRLTGELAGHFDDLLAECR